MIFRRLPIAESETAAGGEQGLEKSPHRFLDHHFEKVSVDIIFGDLLPFKSYSRSSSWLKNWHFGHNMCSDRF